MASLWERVTCYWRRLPHSRSGACFNSLIRILLAPVFVLLEIHSLSQRLVDDEEFVDQDGMPLHVTTGPKIYKNRFKECWRASAPLFFQGVFYTICLEIFAALGLQHILRHNRRGIEHLVALLTGQWYVTTKGKRFPSSPSSGDILHLLPDTHCMDGHSPRCPERSFSAGHSADCPCRASFLIACCKLVYEHQPVIWDALERWGLTPVSYRNIPANMHLGSAYAPDLVWFAATTDMGMVLSFAGAQVWLKVDRMTDIPCAMVDCPEAGRMLKGFVKLFDKIDIVTGATVFDTLASILEGEGAGKDLFLTGHSLGGIIAVTFAMLLVARKPEVARRLTGITSFGSPRLGDAAFSAAAQAHYEGRLFRYVLGSDMVVKLPGKSHTEVFQHHSGERFITWDGRVLKAEEDAQRLKAAEQFEARWAYPLNVLKLLCSIAKMDAASVFRRTVLLPIPGLADHFPADYQGAIDDTLSQSLPSPERKSLQGVGKTDLRPDILVSAP